MLNTLKVIQENLWMYEDSKRLVLVCNNLCEVEEFLLMDENIVNYTGLGLLMIIVDILVSFCLCRLYWLKKYQAEF